MARQNLYASSLTTVNQAVYENVTILDHGLTSIRLPYMREETTLTSSLQRHILGSIFVTPSEKLHNTNCITTLILSISVTSEAIWGGKVNVNFFIGVMHITDVMHILVYSGAHE